MLALRSFNEAVCSILELVRTPVVKQSLLRGTAHFVPTAVADEPACAGREVPPFTRLNFLSENFGGQESGKAAARTERSRSEPHR